MAVIISHHIVSNRHKAPPKKNQVLDTESQVILSIQDFSENFSKRVSYLWVIASFTLGLRNTRYYLVCFQNHGVSDFELTFKLDLMNYLLFKNVASRSSHVLVRRLLHPQKGRSIDMRILTEQHARHF